MPSDLKERANQMLDRLNRMAKVGGYASEFDTLSHYINVLCDIPWDKTTQDTLDIKHAAEMLEKNHHGMPEVKERILEYLATRILLNKRGDFEAAKKAQVLLFVGLQGVGKTTLAASIAQALNRKFVRIAMGALGSVLEIRGRAKAFPEAEPSQIIKALITTQVMNPVILLDEIEKASGSEALRADINAALLEILDPNQNIAFRDHYLDYPLDLSQVTFICSANNTGGLSTALLDRMEIIKMPSYTDAEKITIGKSYLMPKVIRNAGLRPEELQVEDNLWPAIVRPFGFDTGIRSLNRTLEQIARKVAKEIVDGKVQTVVINDQNLRHYLPL
jgi:ATP-dependent Lon protease